MEKFMNENIFREYDIRGIVEKDFPDDVVINLGKLIRYAYNPNQKE